MIDLIAAAGIGGTIGGALVWLAMKEVAADLRDKWFHTACEFDAERAVTDALVPKLRDANAAHTRCSDALETARNRIERALAVETPKAAHGVKKMARLLRGEEA